MRVQPFRTHDTEKRKGVICRGSEDFHMKIDIFMNKNLQKHLNFYINTRLLYTNGKFTHFANQIYQVYA